jgi:hypothetical protein
MDRHIAVCGFSRAGTTLFYNMLRNNVVGFEFNDRETRALESIGKSGNRITKRPLDFENIDQIRQKSAYFEKQIDIIFCIRDPRSLITSYHKSVPDDYFMGCDLMYFVPDGAKPYPAKPGVRPTYEKYMETKDSVYTLRYEDLIADPDILQDDLGQKLNLEFSGKFSDFGKSDEEIPENLTRALNGIRPVDKSRLDAWKEHPDRIKSEFEKNPIMFDILINLGYEKDNEWINSL